MKFSFNWLREWVDLPVTAETLMHQLTMAGLEVDAVVDAAAPLTEVVSAKVLNIEPHPKQGRLKICTVDDGTGQYRVVCAAENAVKGGVYPYARNHARLPAATIGAKTIDGVASDGMLCSAQDLGLEESSTGLLPLDPDTQPGVAIDTVLQLQDKIFELELTPNRGDCLSMRGMAREAAVLNKLSSKAPPMPAVAAQVDARVTIVIEAPHACPRYVGRVIRGIRRDAVTPLWMREKLRRSGIRSLGPVVDVTNYVMLELGQPMHAFDMAKIQGGIVVRMARAGEKLSLLNGEELTLHGDNLLICDTQKPLALAGIMGGEHSGVAGDTADILLESAYFTPELLAGRARRYGLHTDSSHRFERGVDSAIQVLAVERATALLSEITGGQPGPVLEVCSEPHLPNPKPIQLRYQHLQKVLGIAPETHEVGAILNQLGFKSEYSEAQHQWRLTAPSYRPDIALEVDLIEEVARVYGYEHIAPVAAATHIVLQPQPEAELAQSRVIDCLLARGYSESVSYSFVEAGLQAMLDPRAPVLALAHPLSEEMAVMRTKLWPGLLKSCLHNLRRQQNRVRLFEIGLIYSGTPADIKQRKHLAGLATGGLFPAQWNGKTQATDFFQVKGDFEAVLGLTGRAGEIIFKKSEHSALHPGQAAEIEMQGEQIGWIGSLAPHVLAELDIAQAVFVFELDMSVFQHSRVPRHEEVTKFPMVRRDLAFLVDHDLPAHRLMQAIRVAAGQSLSSLDLFDVYVGEKVQEGKKSLAFALQLQHKSGTLTDKEVEEVIEKVKSHLFEKHRATLRE